MQTGTKISGALHVGAIGLIAFGGALFSRPTSDAIQISEVSIISSEDFAALQSSSPDPTSDVATAPKIETPEPTIETAPQIEQPQQQAPVAEQEVAILAPASPAPASRIDTQSAPKPDVNATEAQTPQEEATPDEDGTQIAEPTEAQAPEETTTQIVTEAEKPSEFAPTTSTVPLTRPHDLVKNNTQKPDVAPVTTDSAADEIAAALATAEAENTQSIAPLGPALTGSERAGLVLAVQQCWNVPIGLQDADDLAVVIAIELSQDGKLKSAPKLIEPAGAPTGTIRQAFEAGRRALIRCAPYDLPLEKYEQWRQIEVVFNPKEMVLR